MNKRDLILYVHGWNSHAKARKAQLIEHELKYHEIFETASITLNNHPREAVKQLTAVSYTHLTLPTIYSV